MNIKIDQPCVCNFCLREDKVTIILDVALQDEHVKKEHSRNFSDPKEAAAKIGDFLTFKELTEPYWVQDLQRTIEIYQQQR